MNFVRTERTQVPDMSSWLNTKSFAKLAKNAMSEAQKTLDRALEIPEEDSQIGGVDEFGEYEISLKLEIRFGTKINLIC